MATPTSTTPAVIGAGLLVFQKLQHLLQETGSPGLQSNDAAAVSKEEDTNAKEKKRKEKKTKQNKTKQHKTKEKKTKQNKTKQHKTTQHNTKLGQGRFKDA